MKFSEKYDFNPIRKMLQIDSIDEPLRNGLWNLIKIYCWDNIRESEEYLGEFLISDNENSNIYDLCYRLWFFHFKKPIDELSDKWEEVLYILREFFFKCEWFEVYDFIEFIANNYEHDHFKIAFIESCNCIMEKEASAYRFVDGAIARITEKNETEAIVEALETDCDTIREHLKRSLELLSDRKKPDYRNSIKESISAIESLVFIVLNSDKGKFSQLIKKLEDEIGLHPALKTAFGKLYDYTSDESGIRHALSETNKVDFYDAKFMLVVCSAFVNYVKGKTYK